MQQPRGPATLCIKAKEIDALYDALGYEDMGLEPAPVAAINLRERRRTLRKRLLVPLWRR